MDEDQDDAEVIYLLYTFLNYVVCSGRSMTAKWERIIWQIFP